MKRALVTIIAGGAVIGLALAGGRFFGWGKIQLDQRETITVIGQAKGQQASQVARFSATVSRVNDDKQTAINEVNENMSRLIEKVKQFGIKEEDLKTQNISISQQEETFYEGSRKKTRPGQWRVSNSLEITLRDVDRASALASLLADSGATNVWGPNFYTDETSELEASLLEEAVKDAREKAERLARASGKRLGQIIEVSEGQGQASYGIRLESSGGGGAPIEPGGSQIQKSVTVVFEIN